MYRRSQYKWHDLIKYPELNSFEHVLEFAADGQSNTALII